MSSIQLSNSSIIDLSAEALARVVDLLNAPDVAKLALLTGSKVLRLKLCAAGGISSLNYAVTATNVPSSSDSSVTWPVSLASASVLSQLRNLEVRVGSSALAGLTPAAIRGLPKSLTSLSIESANALDIWIYQEHPIDKANVDFFNRPSLSPEELMAADLANFQKDAMSAFGSNHTYYNWDGNQTSIRPSNYVASFSAILVDSVLPNLLRLELVHPYIADETYSYYGYTQPEQIWTRELKHVWIAGLPRALTSLRLPSWDHWPASLVNLLPPNLTSLDAILHFQDYESRSTKAPTYGLGDEPFVFTDTLSLTKNHGIYSRSIRPPFLPMRASHLPPSLADSLKSITTTARADNVVFASRSSFCNFPSGLTELDCQTLNELQIPKLPPTLTRLTVRGAIVGDGIEKFIGVAALSYTPARIDSQSTFDSMGSVFARLPPSLTSLTLGAVYRIVMQDLRSLPQLRHLSLNVRFESSPNSGRTRPILIMHSTSTLERMTSLFDNLPQSLTSLAISAVDFPYEEHTVDLKRLPTGLTDLTLQVTPNLMADADIAKMKQHKLRRLCLKSAMPSITSACLTKLPRSLTDLSIFGRATLTWDHIISAATSEPQFPSQLHTVLIECDRAAMDKVLSDLPRQFNSITCGGVHFQGYPLARDETSLHSDRILQAVERGIVASWQKNPPSYVSTQKQPLFPHVYGRISLAATVSGHQSATGFMPGNPNGIPGSLQTLTWTISRPPLLQLLWMTPKLTELNALKNVRHDSRDPLPDTLTTLRIDSGVSEDFSRLVNLTTLDVPNMLFTTSKSNPLPASLTSLKCGCAPPSMLLHLTSLTSLELFKTTEDSSVQYSTTPLPASLRHLAVRSGLYEYDPYHRPERWTSAHVPLLPRGLETYFNSRLLFDSKDVPLLPPSLKKLRIQYFVFSSMEAAMAAIPHDLTSLTDPLITLAKVLVQSQVPGLDFTVLRTRIMGNEEMLPLVTQIAEKLPPQVTMLMLWPPPPKLNQLPPGLTYLDLSAPLLNDMQPASPSQHCTKWLPRTLTELRIDATLFSAESIAQMPRSLRTLYLTPMRKFTPKCCGSLPPQLINFRVYSLAAYDEAFYSLPQSITTLSIFCNALTDRFLPYLPRRGLVAFHCSSRHFTANNLAIHLPKSVTALDLPFWKLSPTQDA